MESKSDSIAEPVNDGIAKVSQQAEYASRKVYAYPLSFRNSTFLFGGLHILVLVSPPSQIENIPSTLRDNPSDGTSCAVLTRLGPFLMNVNSAKMSEIGGGSLRKKLKNRLLA